mgnify:CR=1 FL=1
MDFSPHIAKFAQRFQEIETSLSDPALLGNQRRFQEMSKEHARLRPLVEAGEAYKKTLKEIAENRDMLEKEPVDPELGEMAADELKRLEQLEKALATQLQYGIVPPDPSDSRNTIIEIRAAAGGTESSLFAGELYEMYRRYAALQGWKVETMDSSPADLGGFKEIIFNISGTDVYKRLKFESGVHRVQRVPVTEAAGRVHTSTVTVAVLPEAEEVDVEIKPDEVEISVCRASGPGGQGVNTTDSAVQLLHKPTGLIVRCADERSQQKNKAKAFKVLRTRILEARIEEEQRKYNSQRKEQVGGGERNEKIRTYNFPDNRVTDHRLKLTVHSLPAFLEGKIDGIIEPLMANDLEQKLAALK